MSRASNVVEVLARALADRPDDVKVVESTHRDRTLVELFVAPVDLGKMIGRQGRTAAALSLERRAVDRNPLPGYVARIGELYHAAGDERMAHSQHALVDTI